MTTFPIPIGGVSHIQNICIFCVAYLNIFTWGFAIGLTVIGNFVRFVKKVKEGKNQSWRDEIAFLVLKVNKLKCIICFNFYSDFVVVRPWEAAQD